MHVHFDVLKAVPTDVSITTGNGSERDQLRAHLDSGGFFARHRPRLPHRFLSRDRRCGASFVGRVQDNTVIHADEERSLTAAAARRVLYATS